MANGRPCCILGVCCPPGSPAQRKALVAEMTEAGVNDAESAAEFVLEHFDLAVAGTLTQFKATIAKLARESKSQ